MSSYNFVLPFRPAFNSNGLPAAGAKLYFYLTGTTTPTTVYSDSGLTTPLSNPVVADSAGRIPAIYLNDAVTYRLVIKDRNDVQLGSTIDPYTGPLSDDLAAAVTDATAAKNAAQTAATNASNSASAASTSASNASTSATNASNSASAAATSETNAAASAATAGSAVIPRFTTSIKAAIGGGTLKALWDYEGTKTYYSGSNVSQLDSLDDTPLSLVLSSTIYTGTNPRPVYTAGRGLSINAQAGMQISNGLFSSTANDWGLLYSCDLNVSYTSVTLASSVTGGVDGDIFRVTGDTNTTYSPDVTTVMNQEWPDSALVNGFYSNTNGTYGKGPFYLWKLKSSGSKYMQARLSHLGQLWIDIYDGTYPASVLVSPNTNVIGSVLTVGVRRRGNLLFTVLNGVESPGVDMSLLGDITNFATLYINGNDRTANTTVPISGGFRHYFRGLSVAQSMTDAEFRDYYNAFADRHGSPRFNRRRKMCAILLLGQSKMDGAYAVAGTDSWTQTSGWDGEVDNNNGTYSGETNSLTREHFLNAYSTGPSSMSDPADIATYNIRLNGFGNISSGDSHYPNSTGENVVPGFMKQVNNHVRGYDHDYIFLSGAVGGASISTLAAENNTPLIQQLKGATLGGADFYAKLLRAIVYARDFAWSRGQDFEVTAALMKHGESDYSTSNYATLALAYYDKLNAAQKTITGKSNDMVLFCTQSNYAGPSSGTDNGWLASDQRTLDLEMNRGTRPIYCAGPMYHISSFIHTYKLGQRWDGERFGLEFTRVMFDGEPYACLRPLNMTTAFTYSVGGTTIDIDLAGIRSGRTATLSQTNYNAVDATLSKQGFVFTDASAGGVTISSVSAVDADTLRVTLSGAIGTGDVLSYTGTGARFGNITDGAAVDGIYQDQDWTAPLTSGSPKFALGHQNDLRRWLVAFTRTL